MLIVFSNLFASRAAGSRVLWPEILGIKMFSRSKRKLRALLCEYEAVTIAINWLRPILSRVPIRDHLAPLVKIDMSLIGDEMVTV
jgi:hypothetical protein